MLSMDRLLPNMSQTTTINILQWELKYFCKTSNMRHLMVSCFICLVATLLSCTAMNGFIELSENEFNYSYNGPIGPPSRNFTDIASSILDDNAREGENVDATISSSPSSTTVRDPGIDGRGGNASVGDITDDTANSSRPSLREITWDPRNTSAVEFHRQVCKPANTCPKDKTTQFSDGDDVVQADNSSSATWVHPKVSASDDYDDKCESFNCTIDSLMLWNHSANQNYRKGPPEGQCTAVTCFPCDCSKDCAVYGTCCAPNTDDMDDHDDMMASDLVGCADRYYAIMRCPATWTGDVQVKQACEKETGEFSKDEPVTGFSAQGRPLVYRNAACAKCHGVDAHITWELELTCQNFQRLYSATSRHQLFQMAASDPRTCNIWHSPPNGTDPPQCSGISGTEQDSSWFSISVIRDCNVTGQWSAYDAEVDAACHNLTSLAYRVFRKVSARETTIFANVFCYMCNGYGVDIGNCDFHFDFIGGGASFNPGQPDENTEAKKYIAPLSLLFGILSDGWQREESPLEVECLAGQTWLAHTNECRNLTCAAGKALTNDTCSTVIPQISGLLYHVDASFRLTPPVRSSIPRLLDIEDMLGGVVWDSLENHTRGVDIKVIVDETFEEAQIGLSTNVDSFLKGVYQTQHIRMVGDVSASRLVGRDEVEKTLLDLFFTTGWSFSRNNVTFSLQPLAASNVTRLLDTNTSSFFELFEYSDTTYLYDPKFNDEDKLILTPVLNCPYVEFNQTEFVVRRVGDDSSTTVPSMTVALMNEDNEVSLPLTADDGSLLAWVEADRLYVCQEALSKIRRVAPAASPRSWQTVLSLVVLSLSMLCLVLTLLVYSLLLALRTMPGLNTMGTCVALFVAQLSLVLASERVLAGTGGWCFALGVVVHGSWLSVFCWNSLCSLHMFRAFSAKTFHRASSSLRRRVARNVALTTLGPGVVVAAVVAGSYGASGGTTLGYSDVLCYLDGPMLVGLTMVLPVALLLTVNIILFTFTVRRIHQVSKLNPHSDEKDRESQNHVHVCVRLSVLTGATWIISLVAETASVDWLQAVSILANGGQGVLLFLSYVTTRRVLGMLAKRVGLGRETSSSSSPLHTTTTTAHTKQQSPDKNGPRPDANSSATSKEFSSIAV